MKAIAFRTKVETPCAEIMAYATLNGDIWSAHHEIVQVSPCLKSSIRHNLSMRRLNVFVATAIVACFKLHAMYIDKLKIPQMSGSFS